MDEVIYLEPDEEITSAIDKIKNTKAVKLGLVVPREATLLQSVVNLRLLAREAESLGKVIAIVTSDKIGRNLAAQVGLAVYNSIEEQKPAFLPPPPKPSSEEIIEIDLAEKPIEKEESPPGVKVHHFQDKSVLWRKNAAPVFKPKVSAGGETKIAAAKVKDLAKVRKIIWPIIAILVVLLGIASYLLLPKATIKVYVSAEDLKKTLPVLVSSQVKDSSLEQSMVAGELIEVTKEQKDNFSTTGKKNVGGKATGTLTVYNSWDSNSHSFDSRTKFSSSSKTFLATAGFTIPGSSVREGNLVPGSTSMKIEAENPGEEYNVKAGRFTILGLPAAEQEKIYGTSANDLTGGFSKQVQVVSGQDYDNAKKKLTDELASQAEQEFSEKTKDKKVIDKAIVIPDPEVTTTANIDQEAKDFQMNVKYKIEALVFNFSDFKDFLTNLLAKQVPSDKMVVIPKDEDIGLIVDKTTYDKGEMNLTVNVDAKIANKISAERIKKAVLGKKSAEAEQYIKNQEGVSRVEVIMRPSWWFLKIPNIERNVNVQIEYLTG